MAYAKATCRRCGRVIESNSPRTDQGQANGAVTTGLRSHMKAHERADAKAEAAAIARGSA